MGRRKFGLAATFVFAPTLLLADTIGTTSQDNRASIGRYVEIDKTNPNIAHIFETNTGKTALLGTVTCEDGVGTLVSAANRQVTISESYFSGDTGKWCTEHGVNINVVAATAGAAALPTDLIHFGGDLATSNP